MMIDNPQERRFFCDHVFAQYKGAVEYDRMTRQEREIDAKIYRTLRTNPSLDTAEISILIEWTVFIMMRQRNFEESEESLDEIRQLVLQMFSDFFDSMEEDATDKDFHHCSQVENKEASRLFNDLTDVEVPYKKSNLITELGAVDSDNRLSIIRRIRPEMELIRASEVNGERRSKVHVTIGFDEVDFDGDAGKEIVIRSKAIFVGKDDDGDLSTFVSEVTISEDYNEGSQHVDYEALYAEDPDHAKRLFFMLNKKAETTTKTEAE